MPATLTTNATWRFANHSWRVVIRPKDISGSGRSPTPLRAAGSLTDQSSVQRKPSKAARIIQRQFNAALERAGIKHDPFTDTDHTVYSLRHTAICMRIILSEGRVNIFNLAKNAGTSVEQIERFYAKHLPMSKEMAKNLHLFGGGAPP